MREQRQRRGLALLAISIAALGLWNCGRGAWIYAKAGLAQVLLEAAWQRAREGAVSPAPWPWADTWPIARLSAPRLGEERIVLAGASGAVLAFGPGHLEGTASPGASGNSVVAGHRDTHFAFLRRLLPGDRLIVETADGRRFEYRVEWTRIVDEGDGAVLGTSATSASASPLTSALTLVTCYPFDSVVPGGELRFVVRAAGPGQLPYGNATP